MENQEGIKTDEDLQGDLDLKYVALHLSILLQLSRLPKPRDTFLEASKLYCEIAGYSFINTSIKNFINN
jgi:hypothetical protein